MKERIIVVFDFDGTLTCKDTLWEFIKFAKGKWQFYVGIIICSPILIAFLLRIMQNDKAKQFVFRYFFKGMPYRTFKQLGEQFSSRIDNIVNKHTLDILKQHSHNGATIYVISASITEWVEPWCKAHHVSHVLGTQIEISKEQRLTGRFQSQNCYGIEKVNRFLSHEPFREFYHLIAYGDSEGDKELLAFADEGYYVIKDNRIKNPNAQEILRFGIVGCIAVFIQFIVYYTLVNHVNHNIALLGSYAISLAINYLLTTSFTFHVKPSKRNGIGFLGSHLVNFTLQYLLLNLFVLINMNEQHAIIPVLMLCVPINFILVRHFIKKL